MDFKNVLKYNCCLCHSHLFVLGTLVYKQGHSDEVVPGLPIRSYFLNLCATALSQHDAQRMREIGKEICCYCGFHTAKYFAFNYGINVYRTKQTLTLYNIAACTR